MRWIELEDFVPYAFIISIEHRNKRTISYFNLMKYAKSVASNLDATLLVYRDFAYEFFASYNNYFTDHGSFLELKNNISIKELHDLAVPFLTLDLVLALKNPEAVEILLNDN